MSDQNGAGQTRPTALPIVINAQYAKDFSFENPNAPRSLQPQSQGPQINMQVNVNAKQLAETDFEVDLTLEGQAKVGEEVLFAFELTYAGVFRARNVPADQLTGGYGRVGREEVATRLSHLRTVYTYAV